MLAGNIPVLVHNCFDAETEWSKLPPRPGDVGATTGRSSLSDDEIVSGQNGQHFTKAAKAFLGARLKSMGLLRASVWGDGDHVETKVVYMMEEKAVDHAEVVINNVHGPCVKAPPGLSCSNALTPLLGKKTLRVHWRNALGEMKSELFGGVE